MDHVTFDPADWSEIPLALQQCTVPSRGPSPINRHLLPLQNLAERLGASEYARRNMEYLATGSGDLAIILMEPSDKEEDVLYTDYDDYCETIRLLDDSLRFAFQNQRDVKNTVVLDSRPLRSNRIREDEFEEHQKVNDAEAYRAVEAALELLRPKVVVVCNCNRDGIEDGMPEYLCSSVATAGHLNVRKLPKGYHYISVSSFHPMYFARTAEEESMEKEMREYLFDATLLVGANALVGRWVSGFGIRNLRAFARPDPDAWLVLSDVTSEDIISLLDQLEIPKTDGSKDLGNRAQLVSPQEDGPLYNLLESYRRRNGP
ncbi:uncharacterized protein C8A04DRAFT_30705 [Dichotomopilus funicola]|uniref:Uncharacterized protein n=1 Tax=Dichotomopilus funicola TaxID=1934379 RepID=A0AAN6UZP2_9PEZI|nr:hypothetical protein C8A04DRAFT_30705 [Dichotomopilus funicola]